MFNQRCSNNSNSFHSSATRSPDDVLFFFFWSIFLLLLQSGYQKDLKPIVGGVATTRRMLSVYKYESQSFPRQKHSLPPFDWRAGWRRANKKRNPQTPLPSPDKGEPRENIYDVLLHACVYLCYICTFLSKQRWKKDIHDRESYWTQERAHAKFR